MSLSRSIATLLLAIAPLWGQSFIIQPSKAEKSTETRTIPLSLGSSLKVGNINGAIRVEAWEKSEVEFTGEFYPSSTKEQLMVIVESSDGKLVIRGEYPKRTGRHLHYRDATCQMTLKVPREVNVNLGTVQGELTLKGTNGAATLRTVQGGIMLDQVKGSLNLETVDGSIKCTNLDNAGKDVRAESVSGSIHLKFRNLKGVIKTNTVSGNVLVTVNGSEQIDAKRNGVGTATPSGSAKIQIRTVSGDITVQ
jgi:hypothetical protein